MSLKSTAIASSLASVLAAGLGSLPGTSAAQDAHCALPAGNFALRLQVDAECGVVATPTAQAFFDKLDPNAPTGLRSIIPGYSPDGPADALARFNGVQLSLVFPDTGGTVFFEVPELGYSRTFTGLSRDESIELLIEDLKRGDILGRIMAQQAKVSPTSPITGVGGLIPLAIASDFDQNFGDFATQIAAPPADAQAGGSNDLAGAALVLGSFTTDGPDGMRNRVKVATLPLSYTFRNDIDPRRQLMLSIPLSQVDVNGARTWAGGFGMAYRFPINDQWTLVPSGRVSAVGSVDLATVSGVYTVGLTSVYLWDLGPVTVAMGNMLSYNATLKFRSGAYAFDPDVSNTALRNGLLVSQPVAWEGRRMSVEYSFVDTRFVGGVKPYVKQYQEVGVTLGTNKNAYSARSFVRGGITLTWGKGTKGATAKIGYWF